jgi:hypothetical protein
MAISFADGFSQSTRNPFITSARQKKNPFFDSDAVAEQEPDPGILSKIGSVSMSGLEKGANFLDLPGSMVRDALAGENPFDQVLHPFSGENRISGRDLNRRWGLASDEDTWANWFGGVATELVTDPTSYLTLGALTGAGKAARASGTLTKGFAASIASGERSLAHLGIPFTDIGTHVGTGKAAQSVAQGLDWIGGAATRPSVLSKAGLGEGLSNALTYPGRAAKMLFHPPSMGQLSEAGQDAAAIIYQGRSAAERTARTALADVIGDMNETRQAFHDTYAADIENAALAHQPNLKAAHDMIHNTFERVFGLATELGGDLDAALGEFGLAATKATPHLRQKIVDLGNRMQNANRAIHDMNRLKGGKGGLLEELTAQGAIPGFEHFPRYVTPERLSDFQRSLRSFATRHGSTFARDETISHIPQEIINRLLVDDAARASGGANHIAQTYGSYLGKGTTKDAAGNTVPKWNGIQEHAEEVHKWIKQHKEWALFTRSQIENFFKYQRGANLASEAYDAIHELIRSNISDDVVTGLSQGAAQPGVITTPLTRAENGYALVEDVYRAADMNPETASQWLGGMLGGLPADQVKQMTIPLDVAHAIVGARKAVSQPEWAGEIGRTIDTLNGWFKQAVTLPFPSFWTRNLTSGQYVNLATGLIENGADLSAYGRHASEAFQKFRQGLDPAYERELMIQRVLDPDTLFEDVPMPQAAEFGRVSPQNPLDVQHTWTSAGQQLEPGGINSIPGVQQVRQGYNTLLGTGAKASRLVEYMNRVPMYEYLKAKGWTAEAAAAKVAELQIDYSNLSGFEKNVMRRLVPFYTYQRAIAPVILKTLAQRPGGVMGQTLRIARDASDADASTPDYVSETLSIPNPLESGEGGVKSYWTGFGLPFEQHFQYGGGGVRGALREGLSQINPLAKMPLEWATNQSFFQRGPGGAGRPLDELDPTIGRTLANVTGRERPVPTPRSLEYVLSNSPLTRALTTARQLTDPRKSAIDHLLNTFTGTRVTDISPAAQDAVLRDRALQMMKSMDAATFEKVYFRKDDLAQMSPAERQMADRLTQLQTILAERAKARKLKKAGVGNG